MEDPDEFVGLPRAAEISGLSVHTLRGQVRMGKLKIQRFGHERLTTRRWLHEYLMGADERDKGRRKPLPEGYVAPDTVPAPEQVR